MAILPVNLQVVTQLTRGAKNVKFRGCWRWRDWGVIQTLAKQKSKGQLERESLIDAIELIGGVQATADRLGVRRQAVYKWIHYRLPVKRVLQLEDACGRRVTRYELCRDIDIYLERGREVSE